MLVRCIAGVSLGGGRDLYPGDVVELEESHAMRLVTLGSVVPHAGAPAPPSKAEPETMREAAGELQTPAAPEPEHREPRPRRKG